MQLSRDYTEFFDLHTADAATVEQARRDFVENLTALLKRLGNAEEADARHLAERIWRHMARPGRHYHSPVHVLAMFSHADKAGLELTDAEKLAVWFHDVIYDLGADHGRNERASADWMLKTLDGLGVPRSVSDPAAEGIRWTAHHLADQIPAEHQRLIDLDLAGLAAAPDSFDRQSEAVRAEMGHLPDHVYNRGKADFFSKLLNRPHIYRTEAFADYEPHARRQLQREVDRLNGAG